MRKFLQRAIKMLPKMDKEQIHSLLCDVVSENELLEVVLHSMNDGVVVLDAENNIIFYNQSAERFLPFTTSDPFEKPVWMVLGDMEIADFFKQSIENEEKVTDKEFTLDSGGASKTFECSIMPLVKDGKIQGSLIHIADVTEKRENSARLKRAESLAALTTLAAGVAHEIKNPLGSIGIHIQLIQKEINKGKNINKKDISKDIEIVNEEIERLNSIIVDFLFAVRPMDINLKEIDLNQILKDIINFVKPELDETGVKIIEEFDDTISLLELDERYIKQAVINLIYNAVSAMPEGGTLTFTTKEEGGSVFFCLKDSGVGIAEENITKIFEPYFTTKEFGSGLGLTVVYKTVKEHGGEIILKSKKGKGTSFTVRLPVSQKEQRLLGWKGTRNEI